MINQSYPDSRLIFAKVYSGGTLTSMLMTMYLIFIKLVDGRTYVQNSVLHYCYIIAYRFFGASSNLFVHVYIHELRCDDKRTMCTKKILLKKIKVKARLLQK